MRQRFRLKASLPGVPCPWPDLFLEQVENIGSGAAHWRTGFQKTARAYNPARDPIMKPSVCVQNRSKFSNVEQEFKDFMPGLVKDEGRIPKKVFWPSPGPHFAPNGFPEQSCD
jgi:hypothetical protein